MTDVRAYVQKALDSALSREGVLSYWQEKSKTEPDDPGEYIVYTQEGDSGKFYANNTLTVYSARIIIRYYYKKDRIDTPGGRALVKERERLILNTMEMFGFSCPDGAYDAGLIDNSGYYVTILDMNYENG